MILEMIRQIKVSSDWFGCVLVILSYVGRVFSESVTKPSSRFTNVYFLAVRASYAIDDIGGGARDIWSVCL